MSEHIIEIEGQAIPVDPETASSDEGVKQALRGFYPEIAAATINRRMEGAREIITVVKRAGTKGALDTSDETSLATSAAIAPLSTSRRVLARLSAAKPTRNPATRLAAKLHQAHRRGTLTPDEINGRQTEIAEAILAGERQGREGVAACEQLKRLSPLPGVRLPSGF